MCGSPGAGAQGAARIWTHGMLVRDKRQQTLRVLQSLELRTS
jgi:hypothetical protein